jgi:radical SAM protein (TIGR01212 family)
VTILQQVPIWRTAGLRFFAYNLYLRHEFGRRVQKVSVDAGLTCPNVDGRVATGGCVFCDNSSFSPSRRRPAGGITEQIDAGIRQLRRRYRCDRFLAYFQPATNTYAPADRLEPMFRQALSHPLVAGLAIGTRPDCVPTPVLDLLERLAGQAYVSVEYGMQTTDNRLLDWMNRGHRYDAFLDAVERSRGRGFRICAHVILGLPGQTGGDFVAAARAITELNLDAVKIHNLFAVHNTPLADQVRDGTVRLMEKEEYVRAVVDFLQWLTPHCVVERLCGDAPAEFLVGPSWCAEKGAVRAAVEAELRTRHTWQGHRLGA